MCIRRAGTSFRLDEFVIPDFRTTSFNAANVGRPYLVQRLQDQFIPAVSGFHYDLERLVEHHGILVKEYEVSLAVTAEPRHVEGERYQ